jgi:hypothetical protein
MATESRSRSRAEPPPLMPATSAAPRGARSRDQKVAEHCTRLEILDGWMLLQVVARAAGLGTAMEGALEKSHR